MNFVYNANRFCLLPIDTEIGILKTIILFRTPVDMAFSVEVLLMADFLYARFPNFFVNIQYPETVPLIFRRLHYYTVNAMQYVFCSTLHLLLVSGSPPVRDIFMFGAAQKSVNIRQAVRVNPYSCCHNGKTLSSCFPFFGLPPSVLGQLACTKPRCELRPTPLGRSLNNLKNPLVC